MDSTGTRHSGRTPYQVTTQRPPGHSGELRTGQATDQIQGTKPVTTRVSPASTEPPFNRIVRLRLMCDTVASLDVRQRPIRGSTVCD
jgi:hypothetical protein